MLASWLARVSLLYRYGVCPAGTACVPAGHPVLLVSHIALLHQPLPAISWPAGNKLAMEVVKTPGTATAPPLMETVPVYLALHAVHMDYIMRVHVTGWYGPTADHPGGWCRCYKGAALPTSPAVTGPAIPARGRKRAREADTEETSVEVWL